jgi:uncharacterized membrane protein
MNSDLIAACQMFLVPVTILFAALGASSTEQLKTLISIMGIATSAIWVGCLLIWPGLEGINFYPPLILSMIFAAAWIIAAMVHAYLWYEESARRRRAGVSN